MPVFLCVPLSHGQVLFPALYRKFAVLATTGALQCCIPLIFLAVLTDRQPARLFFLCPPSFLFFTFIPDTCLSIYDLSAKPCRLFGHKKGMTASKTPVAHGLPQAKVIPGILKEPPVQKRKASDTPYKNMVIPLAHKYNLNCVCNAAVIRIPFKRLHIPGRNSHKNQLLNAV